MKDYRFIPIYGLMRALAEYDEAGRVHHLACQRHSQTKSWDDYQATWRAFEKTWPAMDRAIESLWITVGELLVIGLFVLVVLVSLGVVK